MNGQLTTSGKIGLGTQAGTSRSIAAHYGDSAPHVFYQEFQNEVSHGTGLKFSDFYGAETPTSGCNPPVTNCLWTHYDFSGCSTGSGVSAVCTTSLAAEQQCLQVIRACAYSKNCCTNVSGCIKARTSNNISNNYLWVDNYKSFKTCDGNSYWGGANNYPNTVFLVWHAEGGAAYGYYNMIRWNSGYQGYALNSYSYWYPFYSGHTWQAYAMRQYNYWHNFYVYGSDGTYYGSYPRFCSQQTTCGLDLANDSAIVGHRICTPMSYTANSSNYDWEYIDKTQTQRAAVGCYYPTSSSRYYQRCSSNQANGFDYFNGFYYYCLHCCYSRVAECFAIGEYLHYKCFLTETEWNNTFTYLKNKWSVTGGTGSC